MWQKTAACEWWMNTTRFGACKGAAPPILEFLKWICSPLAKGEVEALSA